MVDTIAQMEAERMAYRPYDATDPIAVQKAEERAAKQEAYKREAIRALMETPQGRVWMAEVLEFCHIYEEPFTRGETDVTSFKLGRANVGRYLMGDIQAVSPERYLEMLKESKAI